MLLVVLDMRVKSILCDAQVGNVKSLGPATHAGPADKAVEERCKARKTP
jgi:hypothetical protein